MPEPKIREKTAVLDEATEMMGRLEIMTGSLEFPKKTDAGKAGGERVQVKTNLFPIKMEKQIKVYQWKVDKADLHFIAVEGRKQRHPLDLIAEISNRFTSEQRVELCRKLFDLAIHYGSNNSIDRSRIYYDGAQMVYSLDPLPMSTVELIAHNSQNEGAFRDASPMADHVVFALISTEKIIELNAIPNFDQATADATSIFRPLQQFIETATTEHALQTGHYFVNGGGTCYDLNDQDPNLDRASKGLPFGAYFAGGAQKSARIVKNSNGSAQASLAIKAVATPFHIVQTVSEKVLGGHPRFATYTNGQLAGVELMLKGLQVLPVHRPHVSRCMTILGLDTESSRTRMIDYGDKRPSQSVFDYFLSHHNIEIEHPDLPLLIIKDKKSNNKNYMPMSLCEVANNQSLKGDYAKTMVSQVLGVNCVLPRVFEENVLKAVNALEFSNSPCLQQAGLSIRTELTKVEARVLPTPELVFARGQAVRVQPGSSNWRALNYSIGSNIGIWALWVVERPMRQNARRFTGDRLEAFARKFVDEARRRGVQIAEPADTRFFDIPINGGAEFEQLDIEFGGARQAGCQFIMLLTDLEDKAVHPTLKKLELKYQIVTQNVTLKTVGKFLDAGGNLETVTNVIQKTNEKNGGVNYILKDTTDGKCIGESDLFIGIATNQLTGEPQQDDGSSPSSVIGYSANDEKVPSKFTGDYIFASPFRNEVIGVIKPILEKTLDRYTKNCGKKPNRIFIYLNGIAEGDYADLLMYVVPIARATIRSAGCNAPLTIVNGTKLHSVRIIPSNIPSTAMKARDQNVKPGTVVDTGIVSPLYDEFYLVSHASSLGTACPPRFSVICNDGNLSSDIIQRTTFYLAFAFQIINRTVSMPTPIQIALEMAKRGRMNLNSATSLSAEIRGSEGIKEVQERLTSILSYGDKDLRKTRFNA